ncbi:hypothetical protein FRC17_005570 [Serendipita sp. 399]|nr:hypothetical protein FRC17_005570 [Serendipita sp. 399]
MALVPIVNSGLYKIKNLAHGSIRDDEGALGAIGNSKSEELVWSVIRNADGTYTLQSTDPAAPANPERAISEIEKRYYISVEPSAVATRWRLQPILSGSDPRILFVIYQDPRDNAGHCDILGHWELNNDNKKEPVKLNRYPEDEENKPVPANYGANALWIFEAVTDSSSQPPKSY